MTETPDVTANHGHLGSVKIWLKPIHYTGHILNLRGYIKIEGWSYRKFEIFLIKPTKDSSLVSPPSLLFNMLGGTFSFSVLPSSSFLFRPLVKYRKFTLPKAIISPSQSVVFIEYNSQISHVERDYACSGGFFFFKRRKATFRDNPTKT